MTENKPHKIKRWQYRLENYQNAFSLLCEAVETLRSGSITQLEKEGLIQRFAYTWELAWKLLTDLHNFMQARNREEECWSGA